MKEIIWFVPKKIVQDKYVILDLKMAHLQKFGLALRIFLKFCRMKGANKYMKIFLVVLTVINCHVWNRGLHAKLD